MEVLTRRQFLTKVGQTAGVAGLAYVMHKSGLMSMAHAADMDWNNNLPPKTGKGKSVAVLGAGVSGLRAAWELAAGGFVVTVLEAAPYMGGRSQTIRPSSGAYKSNWLGRQNGKFPESAYHHQIIQENIKVNKSDTGTVASHIQNCEFEDDDWEAGKVIGNPDDIYLNAGPGRIPSFHNALLDHCRKFDVALEPFTFTSRQNLMQKDGFNIMKPAKDGKFVKCETGDNDATCVSEPARLGRVKHSLREHLAKMLEKMELKGELDKVPTPEEKASFQSLLEDFGGIKKPKPGHQQAPSDRRGYEQGEAPGGWFNEGNIRPQFSLADILDEKAWNPGLFNDTRVYWQTSLMQPTGGMDHIWTSILTKPLPNDVGGGTIEHLVKVGAPVTKIKNITEGDISKVYIEWAGQEEGQTFDFCVSTMGPKQLSKVVEDFSEKSLSDYLGKVPYTASCKVGWQSKGRWFEEDYEIYGGISWIDDIDQKDDKGNIINARTNSTQVWYPSQDFHSRNATLTGAYNRGEEAEAFGKLSLDERLDYANRAGAKLHNIPSRGLKVTPEKFKNEMVYFERGMSIAWQSAPYQDGGWVDHKFEHGDTKTSDKSEVKLWDVLASQPFDSLYLAGDWISHTPGWQEGSIRTAMASVYAIAGKCVPAQDENSAGSCRYENLG